MTLYELLYWPCVTLLNLYMLSDMLVAIVVGITNHVYKSEYNVEDIPIGGIGYVYNQHSIRNRRISVEEYGKFMCEESPACYAFANVIIKEEDEDGVYIKAYMTNGEYKSSNKKDSEPSHLDVILKQTDDAIIKLYQDAGATFPVKYPRYIEVSDVFHHNSFYNKIIRIKSLPGYIASRKEAHRNNMIRDVIE